MLPFARLSFKFVNYLPKEVLEILNVILDFILYVIINIIIVKIQLKSGDVSILFQIVAAILVYAVISLLLNLTSHIIVAFNSYSDYEEEEE